MSESVCKAITYTNLVGVIHTENEKYSINFEITYRPKAGFPYYFVQGYWKNLGDSRYTFLVHEHSHEIFHSRSQFFLSDEKIPLAQWITDGLKEVKQSWKIEAPSTKLKINIDKELEYWQKAAKESAKQ